MDYIKSFAPLVLSVISLIISGLALYMVHFHKRKALLLRIKKQAIASKDLLNDPKFKHEFVLINPGKTDITITDIACCWSYNNGENCHYFTQKITPSINNSHIIESGKACSFSVEFIENPSKGFIEKNGGDKGVFDTYEFILKLKIDWVDIDGEFHPRPLKPIDLFEYKINSDLTTIITKELVKDSYKLQ